MVFLQYSYPFFLFVISFCFLFFFQLPLLVFFSLFPSRHLLPYHHRPFIHFVLVPSFSVYLLFPLISSATFFWLSFVNSASSLFPSYNSRLHFSLSSPSPPLYIMLIIFIIPFSFSLSLTFIIITTVFSFSSSPSSFLIYHLYPSHHLHFLSCSSSFTSSSSLLYSCFPFLSLPISILPSSSPSSSSSLYLSF